MLICNLASPINSSISDLNFANYETGAVSKWRKVAKEDAGLLPDDTGQLLTCYQLGTIVSQKTCTQRSAPKPWIRKTGKMQHVPCAWSARTMLFYFSVPLMTRVVVPTSDNPIVVSDSGLPVEKCDAMELACPLCRGQVKGWTVVEPAREYLNAKQRSCMQDDCSFVGTYKELRKHMKVDHPTARPREVDPSVEQKWRRLEREREHDDVISTIRSTMPGAMVLGDYVIEGNHYGLDTDAMEGRFDANNAGRDGGFEMGIDSNFVNVFLLLHAFGASGNDLGRRPRQTERSYQRASNESDAGIRHTTPVGGLEYSDQDDDDDDEEEEEELEEDDSNNGHDAISLVSRLRRHGRVLLNRSGRRRRHREVNEGRDR
ncbi:hypothetical protein QYF36_008573 [Acer negundo]|nr:hypothetical protein QYF36_008573 [Acer negundo]